MRLADAPRPGWYPDPEGRTRLRWWDGSDWSDRYRARPSANELSGRVGGSSAPSAVESIVSKGVAAAQEYRGSARHDADAIIAEVRQVARSEIERAADVFTARARSATQDLQPLFTEYTTKFTRALKVASFILVMALIGWFVFQFVIQESFYDWLGDRIDNLTD